MDKALIARLRHNQRCLVEELIRRNIEVELIDAAFEVIEARHNGRCEVIIDADSSLMPYTAATLTNNKYLTKKVLEEAGLRVPRGAEFFHGQFDDALLYFSELGCAAVAKPSVGTGGDEVHINLESRGELAAAIESIARRLGPTSFLVEEMYKGNEYRVFITRAGQHAALYREPAYVIGNGRDTIKDLAAAETSRRRDPAVICLAPMIMDHIAAFYLEKQGRGFGYIPAVNEKIYVRANSNVGTGGVCHDYTDELHPSVVALCERVLAAFPGMPYAGIDFMCHDASRPQTEDSYRIIEVNPLPSLGIHMTPAIGRGRNVAGMLIDLIFPENAG